MKVRIFILTFVCVLFYFCSSNCDSEMDDIEGTYGKAEETSSYSSEGYHSETWWYWSKGVSYTFTWGSSIEGDCDMSTYTFSPISADATAEQKSSIKSTLIDRQISLKGIY